MTLLNLLLVSAALLTALAFRPWRQLAGGTLLSPLLAALVITPWLWALPWLQHMPMRLQLSGACLILLALGWPLAMLVFGVVALACGWIAPVTPAEQLDMALWLGMVPATLALGLGWVLRRCAAHNPFVYILGRAFLGTALCGFAASTLAHWSGHALGASVEPGLALVARWLLAWGDAIMTGMIVAICVAFRPHWLATWSDRLYLRAP
ncbi:MAG: hypothetical protein R3E52_02200 [Burkholderiaceae bacterium]